MLSLRPTFASRPLCQARLPLRAPLGCRARSRAQLHPRHRFASVTALYEALHDQCTPHARALLCVHPYAARTESAGADIRGFSQLSTPLGFRQRSPRS